MKHGEIIDSDTGVWYFEWETDWSTTVPPPNQANSVFSFVLNILDTVGSNMVNPLGNGVFLNWSPISINWNWLSQESITDRPNSPHGSSSNVSDIAHDTVNWSYLGENSISSLCQTSRVFTPPDEANSDSVMDWGFLSPQVAVHAIWQHKDENRGSNTTWFCHSLL